VEFEVCTLTPSEPANVNNALRFDAHPLERMHMCDWGDDQVTGIFEADEAPIK
jgi:hypothetical protein